MSLYDWLRTVDDEALAAWANRGLLRRAQKLLDTQTPGDWTLLPDQASAAIDGHRQTVAGVGFERLACSCPALEPCHHLLCLMLGLRSRLTAEASAGSADVLAAQPASDVPLAEPWQILDADARLAALGRPALTRAQRWLAQGVSAQLEIDVDKLTATLDAPDRVRLMIPRTGGLAASVCSCRESRCAHRALVVLQFVGNANPADAADVVQALGPHQLATLGALDRWLTELATIGISGASALVVARGEALATELVQADLPHPGRMLGRLARALDDECRAMAGSRVRQVRGQLAELLAYRRALARNPLPQPLPRLAGVHRRAFLPRRDLPLICVAAECWETTSGFHGYSLHFLSPQDGRTYSFSEARGQALDPRWEPQQALASASVAGHRATALLGMSCVLENGWISDEGRLANRDGTRLRVEGPFADNVLRALAEVPQARLRRIAEFRGAWLYRADPQPWGVVFATVEALPAFDRFAQRWIGEGCTTGGERFPIVLPGTAAGAVAARRLQQLATGCGWLFGRWSVENDRAVLSPIAVGGPGSQSGTAQLFCKI